jgi:hypothetical protein
MNITSIREHIEQRWRNANLKTRPFHYVTISDFFPPDVYSTILRLNPFRYNVGEEWRVPSDPLRKGARTPYERRKQIKLTSLDGIVAGADDRGFWGGIADLFLRDEWFFNLVVSTLPQYFEFRFGEAMQWPDLWLRLRREVFLQRHEANYFIGPHTDVPSRIFTCLFSLAETSGFEEYGTQILRPRDSTVRCSGRIHHEFDGFDVVETVPYAANQFLLFFKTRQSFHAVKRIPGNIPNQRFGMQLQCYEPGFGLFKDLSHPDLMASQMPVVANVS